MERKNLKWGAKKYKELRESLEKFGEKLRF